MDWLDELEELGLLELLTVGRLGVELGELDEVLGRLGMELDELGEELGILGAEDGEDEDEDELGMLGLDGELDEDELEVVSQPATRTTENPRSI